MEQINTYSRFSRSKVTVTKQAPIIQEQTEEKPEVIEVTEVIEVKNTQHEQVLTPSAEAQLSEALGIGFFDDKVQGNIKSLGKVADSAFGASVKIIDKFLIGQGKSESERLEIKKTINNCFNIGVLVCSLSLAVFGTYRTVKRMYN